MTSATTQPNIVWISTHDINPDLSTYAGVWPGADYASTPHLDALAAEGVRFDAAFASAPVCAPSRSAIITGCHPTAIGTMHMRSRSVLPADVRLLPEYFRRAGYYTTNNVFTDFQVDVPESTFDDCSPTAHWRGRPSPETPFFAAFHGMTTHEFQIYLDDETFAARTSALSPAQRHDPADAPLPPYYPDTEVFRTAWARYSDLISAMDLEVAQILAQLEEDGLADNTIVVFWSDHGKGMPRAKRWANEAGLREPLIVRWPGRIAPGTVRTDPVQLLDLAPTMLAACGLEVPAHMHGTPLFDASGTALPESDRYVFGGRDRMDEQEDTTRTVRDARYRFIRNYHPDRSPMQHCDYPDRLSTWQELRRLTFEEATQIGAGAAPDRLTPAQRTITAPSKPELELYDIAADPHEMHNLADDPAYGDIVSRMDRALSDWQARFGDLGLIPEAELLEQWRPHGDKRVVRLPILDSPADLGSARSETPGAVIEWSPEPPRSDAVPLRDPIGGPLPGGRPWFLRDSPAPLPESGPIWVRATRIGYAPSAEVEVDLPARA